MDLTLAIAIFSPIVTIGAIIYKSGEQKQQMVSAMLEIAQLKADFAKHANSLERLHTRATSIEQRELATQKAIDINDKRIEDLGNKVNSGEIRMVRIETLIEGVAKDIHSIKEHISAKAA